MRRRRALTGRAGLTLIETTVSVAVTGGLLVAALAMLGDVSTGRVVVSDRTRGAMLAHDLLAEVQAAKYESSDFGPGSFGRAADEPAGGPRDLYDDVDDYAGWSASPPQWRDGSPMSALEGWTRSVRVVWIEPDGDLSGTDQRLKRIEVTVTRGQRLAGRAVAIRAAAWDEIGPERGTDAPPADETQSVDLLPDLPILGGL